MLLDTTILQTKIFHITFKQSVRVMLMDTSVPIAAITGVVQDVSNGANGDAYRLRPRMIFPEAGGQQKASIEMMVPGDNIAGIVEVKQP